MIIAREKKKTNIIEYILYMWQIEDMIRANSFDLDKINQYIIQNFEQPKEIKEEMYEWYKDLVQRMENEQIKEKGHLGFLNEIIQQLDNLHNELIKNPKELEYIEAYNAAKPALKDLKQKAKGTVAGDVEASLQGLYGILMLKLKQKPLNPETKDALASISHLMALLNDKYMGQMQ
ncbi:MAG: DUF4924 family protein [Bacteroidota bacterium]